MPRNPNPYAHPLQLVNRPRAIGHVSIWRLPCWRAIRLLVFRKGLTLPLSKPFVYDPRLGNLLIEIIKDRTSRDGDGPIYVDGNIDIDGVAMASSVSAFGRVPG